MTTYKFLPIVVLTAVFLAGMFTQAAQAADRTWIGGDGSWLDGGSTALWSPADEPDSNDVAIFNTANEVTLGSGNTIAGLTLSGGIDLSVGSAYTLVIDGPLSLSGAGTNLFVDGADTMVYADSVTINDASTLQISEGGDVHLAEESGAGLLLVATGGVLRGNGSLTLGDFLDAPTALVVNNGTINAAYTGFFFGLPPARTFSIIPVDAANARIDLDGTTGNGALTIGRSQTLDINVTLADAFTGSVSMFPGSVLDIAGPWEMDGGTFTVDNGAVDVLPAGISTLTGGAFTQSGGTITVVDGDGTFRISAPSTLGAAVVNNGLLEINANTVISNTATVTMPTNTSSITVNSGFTLTVNQANFNPDGNGTATNILTVNDGANLDLNLGAGADSTLDGDIKLAGGVLDVQAQNNTWTIGVGVLTVAPGLTPAATSSIVGDDLTLAGTEVVLEEGGTLNISSALNITGNTSFTGPGTLRFNGTVNVTGNTTIDVDILDWDGIGSGSLHTIASGASLLIQMETLDGDGDMADPISIGGNGGTLSVSGPESWQTIHTISTNPQLSGMTYISGTSRLQVSGAGDLVSNFDTTLITTATFDSGAAIDINAGKLWLAGGTLVDANYIYGTNVAGPGTLAAENGKALLGYGTINAPIDFDLNSTLQADLGVLNIGGTIVDVGTLAVSNGAVLNITNAWNTSVTDQVEIYGGEIRGATITNAVGRTIRGEGLISAPIINNGTIRQEGPETTLTVQTAGNDNDWDGTTNNGILQAEGGDMLLVDTGSFPFVGSIEITDATLSTSGFILQMQAASSINLHNGTFYSSVGHNLAGSLTVEAAGTSTIDSDFNFFTFFGATAQVTLKDNLRVRGNNIIVNPGAEFSGAGALIVPAGSGIVMNDGVEVGALFRSEGRFRPGGFGVVGRVDLQALQMASSSETYFELEGIAPNEFDLVNVDGTAQLNGRLQILAQGGFVPMEGQTFTIISATGGVTGTFSSIDTSGFPNGLTVKVEYLPAQVQVTIIPGGAYETWILSFAEITNPADRAKDADPDGDGDTNLAEFATDGDPTDWAPSGKVVGKISSIEGIPYYTLIFPVRSDTVLDLAYPGDGTRLYTEDSSGPEYIVQGASPIDNFTLNVTQITNNLHLSEIFFGLDLPTLNIGWAYVVYRVPGPVTVAGEEYMRLLINEQ